MSRDIAKTVSFLGLHLAVGFSVAYALTGSIAIAGGIALIEPLVNSVVFFFHERAWRGELTVSKLLEAFTSSHNHNGLRSPELQAAR